MPPPQEPAPPGKMEPQLLFVPDSDSQVHLQVAFRGFSRQDKRIMPLRLLRRILCGSGSSRLHLALRERLGIVYSVDASIAAYEETGAFAIELSTAPENLTLAVEEVLRHLALLATDPLPADELERVKLGYFFDLEYSRDSTYEMQIRYGWGELMELVQDVEADKREAEEVTAETIMAVAQQLFARHNLNLVAVGSWRKEDRRQVNDLVAGYNLRV